MGVPYTFATATTSIPLSQLDANFNTPVTIGSTTVGLGNTVSTLTNVTLSNATITSVSTPITVPQGGTGLTSLTAGYIPFGNGTSAFGSTGGLFWDNTNGRLGVGTSTPSAPLNVFSGGIVARFGAYGTTTYDDIEIQSYAGLSALGTRTTTPLAFNTNSTERMRIDASGNFFVNATAQSGDRPNNTGIQVLPVGDIKIRVATDSQPALQFYSPTGGGTPVGSVNAGASATSYNTSSDYRLKDNVAPMTGALNIVSKLKPVTYTWKADGSDGQGFIAHELQSVVPDCVTGEKDAVDAEGKPVYQGIDTSFLVATLTAAIQELNAKFEEYKASHP